MKLPFGKAPVTQKIDCGGDPAFPFPCVNSYSYVFRSPIKSEPAKSILNPRILFLSLSLFSCDLTLWP